MRFSRGPRYVFTDTQRKRAAVLVRQRKDRDKLPLFSSLIGEQQPSVDDVMEQRQQHWERSIIMRRHDVADPHEVALLASVHDVR